MLLDARLGQLSASNPHLLSTKASLIHAANYAFSEVSGQPQRGISPTGQTLLVGWGDTSIAEGPRPQGSEATPCELVQDSIANSGRDTSSRTISGPRGDSPLRLRESHGVRPDSQRATAARACQRGLSDVRSNHRRHSSRSTDWYYADEPVAWQSSLQTQVCCAYV